MRWVMWIAGPIAVGLGLLLVVASRMPSPPAEVVCGEAWLPKSERAYCEARANREEIVRGAEFREAMETEELNDQIMVLRYGEAVAGEIFRCTNDPPRHKANQERGKKLAARVQRDDAEAEAREKHDRDNW